MSESNVSSPASAANGGVNPIAATTSNSCLSTSEGIAADTFDAADFAAFLSRYEGFGSFFSADVEVLIRQDVTEYVPPTFPTFASLERALAATTQGFITDASLNSDANDGSNGSDVIARLPSPPSFGKAFRDTFFSISNDFTFVNHGAFGGALKIGTHLKHQYEALMEQQLLTYMDRSVLPWITHATRLVADRVLDCKHTDVVLVPNATYGLNAAIAGLVGHGDVVVFFETEYLAVFKMLLERCEALLAASLQSGGALAPAALKELPLDGLMLDSATMGDDAALAEHIANHLPADTTVVVMDLITSTASLHFPVFTHIIPALRKRWPNVKIIVDGAHGPLQCEVKLNQLPREHQPSVYVGNLHKWFSAPKSVGVMWVREDMQEDIRPLIVSHGAKNGFLSDFVWDGTRDYGAILTLPAIIGFWYDYIGIEKVRAYCDTLKQSAIRMLTEAWGSPVKDVPRGAPFMSLVMLPTFFQHHSKFITAKYLQDTLHQSYSIEVPVKVIRGNVYLRVSFFVNNEMRDYERLRDAVLAIERDVVAELLKARAVRLSAVAKLGEKREREDEAAGAEDLEKQLQSQPHHDKSQIVRNSPVVQPAPAPNATATIQHPHSAANNYSAFKPGILDVPLGVAPKLQSLAGMAQVIVKSTVTSLKGAHNNSGTTEATMNGAGLDDSSNVTSSADAKSGGSPVRMTGLALEAPPAPIDAVDPNCNGCGLGALGAAPKKSRKFEPKKKD